MTIQDTEHGDHHYELVHTSRTGTERVHPFATDEPLEPGSFVRYEGRYWLIERLDGSRAIAKPGRYRLELRHPRRPRRGRRLPPLPARRAGDRPHVHHCRGRTAGELGGARTGGSLTTSRTSRTSSSSRTATTRSSTRTSPTTSSSTRSPAARSSELPASVEEAFARAEREGLSAELVALDPGEEPDWTEAASSIDALILEEIEDDLIEQCGVDPRTDPRGELAPEDQRTARRGPRAVPRRRRERARPHRGVALPRRPDLRVLRDGGRRKQSGLGARLDVPAPRQWRAPRGGLPTCPQGRARPL